MKTAIVTPAINDPERLFGAERHFLGMVQAFKRQVETDWIQVPVSESRWETLLQGYLDCYDLDLSGYDLVVSTKSPTYMAQHPNQICWLLHQIRVFYDRFDDEYGKLPGPALAERQRQRQTIQRLDGLGLTSSPQNLYQRPGNRPPPEALQRIRRRGAVSARLYPRPVLRRTRTFPAAWPFASLEASRPRHPRHAEFSRRCSAVDRRLGRGRS